MKLLYAAFFTCAILFSCLLLAVPADQNENTQPTSPSHILYLMHTGKTAQALQAYRDYTNNTGTQDFELIERLGLILLDQGYRSKDAETQKLTLFGAGISSNEKALYIIENSIGSDAPEMELIALSFLPRFQNEIADKALHRAMTSNYVLIRLEAASQLALKKDPKAAGQIEGLMSKLPEEVWPLFPQLFAALGTPQAKKILRKLLTNRHEPVRVASILSAAEFSHDDYLPVIRRLASHHEPLQLEACAAALGILKDEYSISRLLMLSQNPNTNIKLAALNSLYHMGREEAKEGIIDLAKQQNLFAIYKLRDIRGSENQLAALIKYDDIQVRANAALALLEHGDKRCLPTIAELLLTNSRDYAIVTITSQGKSLTAMRVIPSATQNLEDDPVSIEMSLHLREEALAKAVELPEPEFITLAHAIFERQQNDLIPALIEVLVNHPTPAVIELLKIHQQKPGAPLVRNYCNLALYRLKQPGPYAENLRDWVTKQCHVDLIRFRTAVPWDQREMIAFELTPQETSRLLVDAFEAFVSSQDDKGIDILISVIQTGNSKNKYALIGLLMRAIQ